MIFTRRRISSYRPGVVEVAAVGQLDEKRILRGAAAEQSLADAGRQQVRRKPLVPVLRLLRRARIADPVAEAHVGQRQQQRHQRIARDTAAGDAGVRTRRGAGRRHGRRQREVPVAELGWCLSTRWRCCR